MAAGIVDYLELIQVDVQQRIGAVPALRAEHRRVKAIVEFPAIDEPRQRVMAGLVGQRALEASFLGDIMEYDDGTDHPALPIANRRRRFLDGHFLPRPCDQNRMIGRRAGLMLALPDAGLVAEPESLQQVSHAWHTT